ncbi:MAG: hypothetical protein AAF748_00485 [Pseudomonadota bacterium]
MAPQRDAFLDSQLEVASSRRGLSAAEIVGAMLSIVWVAGVGLFFLFSDIQPQNLDRLNFVMTLIAIFMPVAMIWVAVVAARSNRIMREESARLQAALDAIQTRYEKAKESPANTPTVEAKLEEIARAARKTETALATFTSIRQPLEIRAPESAAMPVSDDMESDAQPALALETPVEATPQDPVTVGEFLRSLNFPQNADDAEGFRALRRALRDRQTAQLITAAKDVLARLAEDGIYMDDMTPERARPEIWRRFARGERGRPVAGLGGIRDRSSMALSASRMREDPVFRDAVHQFLRRFDDMLVSFEPMATDAEIAELSDTRTARAFMLLGRVTGTFA